MVRLAIYAVKEFLVVSHGVSPILLVLTSLFPAAGETCGAPPRVRPAEPAPRTRLRMRPKPRRARPPRLAAPPSKDMVSAQPTRAIALTGCIPRAGG